MLLLQGRLGLALTTRSGGMGSWYDSSLPCWDSTSVDSDVRPGRRADRRARRRALGDRRRGVEAWALRGRA